ncbi:uncharacterized protein [Littorina saxatilis]|uniref:Uncharacterized protein n=1 Tax=Littorina saxatilis TaxID=31220 RepID=A0AAN9BXI0_9CAEN
MFHTLVLLRFSVMVLLTSGGAAFPVWINLGHQECFNGRVNETCGYGQFCSTDEVKKGCRNCTDDGLHLAWCDRDPEEFRRRYPSCEIFCERELWGRKETKLKNQIVQQAKELDELDIVVSDIGQDLKDKSNDYSNLTIVVIGLAVVAIFALTAVIILLCCWRKEKIQSHFQRQQIGTAGLWNAPRSCLCFPRKKKSPAQVHQDEGDVSTEPRGPLLTESLEDRITPTAPQQVTDSCHANETNNAFNGSNDNVNNTTASDNQ